MFNLAWSQHFTLEQFLREVEAALGVEEQQQFHSDDDSANMYLYPTVSPHVYLLVIVLRKVFLRRVWYKISYRTFLLLSDSLLQGVYTVGGMVRDAPWRKLGGGIL